MCGLYRVSETLCSIRSVYIIFAIFFYLQSAACQLAEISNTKLELVQVVFRHGNRTPEFPYYGDPNAFESFHPYGWDTLVTAGYQNSYKLGVHLREIYRDFIPDDSLKQVRIWTTDVVRTKLCAQLVASGLFPPSDDFKWGPPGSVGDLWDTLPYEFLPLQKDNLLYMKRIPCPAYAEDHKKVLEEEPIALSIYEKHADLIEAVYTYAKPPSNKIIPEIARLSQSLLIENYFNLTTPEWAKPFFPDDFLHIAVSYFKMTAWTRKMQRLTGGPLLGHVIRQMEDKQKGSILKFGLYSGHDNTLAFLGRAMRVWDDFFPDFNSALIIELHSNNLGQYFVRTFFLNDTSKPPLQLTVPGCQKSCELKEFRRILNDSIPVDHAAECMQVSRSSGVRPTIFVLLSFVFILYVKNV